MMFGPRTRGSARIARSGRGVAPTAPGFYQPEAFRGQCRRRGTDAGLGDQRWRTEALCDGDRLFQAFEEFIVAGGICQRHHRLGDEAGDREAGLVERGLDGVDVLVAPEPEFDAVEPGLAGQADAIGEIGRFGGEEPFEAG